MITSAIVFLLGGWSPLADADACVGFLETRIVVSADDVSSRTAYRFEGLALPDSLWLHGLPTMDENPWSIRTTWTGDRALWRSAGRSISSHPLVVPDDGWELVVSASTALPDDYSGFDLRIPVLWTGCTGSSDGSDLFVGSVEVLEGVRLLESFPSGILDGEIRLPAVPSMVRLSGSRGGGPALSFYGMVDMIVLVMLGLAGGGFWYAFSRNRAERSDE